MKTCPNCGSKMDVDVNFCTNCGTDIRNVPVDSTMNSQEVKPEPEVQPVMQTRREQKSANQSETNNSVQNNSVQPDQPAQQTSNIQQPAFDSEAVKAHAANMWQWFVTSWKHPFADQNGERWYGWVTLLVEDFLIGLGLFIGEQRATGAVDSMLGNSNLMSGSANFTFGTVIEIILFLALAEAAWILAAHLTYKVIYGKSKDFLELTNHVVQTSNLSAIFIVVYFVFMALMGPAGIVISTIMLWLAAIFFSMALTVVVLGDQNPIHDKFYGYFLFIALQFITGVILFLIIGGTIFSQIGSSIPGL
ncbi:zinc-ribbon domain-containing protein [Lactobacillus crispatus]|uniref:zinc ribbon domain-containing protein n=1 Tax=Lactobacillus crispatus TaxID=47770 RepID=UPI0013032050|nr:zinc ribbon domain-containing protein [Lactobacillus crispatus]QGY94650.1 zinc-ribbon domain-containing protein [Lactobacillus crispatus]